MYARLCSATGWTWEYVGQHMTMQRLYAFLDLWREAPPVAESVARFIGITPAAPTASASPSASADAKRNAFMQNAPAKVVRLPR